MLTDRDLRYLEEQFTPLDELCAPRGIDAGDVRRRIAAGELPAFPYPGFERLPGDYFELPLGAAFAARYAGSELDADLEGLMSGIYFVCLRNATPENIVRKEALATEIRTLLADARPEDESWLAVAGTAIAELDALERPFSPDYDRQRFGRPPTRDELIAEPRRRFPGL